MKLSRWLGKRSDLEQKKGAFREQIEPMRANEVERITSEFKMDVIKGRIVNCFSSFHSFSLFIPSSPTYHNKLFFLFQYSNMTQDIKG